MFAWCAVCGVRWTIAFFNNERINIEFSIQIIQTDEFPANDNKHCTGVDRTAAK